MKICTIYRNTHSGQNKGTLLRIQVGYTAIHLGHLGGNWQGPSWGIWAPSEYSGPARMGFYGSFLPALGTAVAQWPGWYRRLWRATSFRFCVQARLAA